MNFIHSVFRVEKCIFVLKLRCHSGTSRRRSFPEFRGEAENIWEYRQLKVTVNTQSFGGRYSHKSMKIQKLTFYNHTECTCQDRTDEMPRDTDLRTGLDTNRITNQPSPLRCKCPSEYTVRYLANGSCTCDCFDKQRDCTKYKRGKENFNHHDRICIETGKCTIPSCDFGVFNRRLGRCPKKAEKFHSWRRYQE